MTTPTLHRQDSSGKTWRGGLLCKSEPRSQRDYQKEDYPKNLAYTSTVMFYIGDNDLTLSNAEAQYFYVDPSEYPDGFNLTNVKVGGVYGTNGVVEVYDGAMSISKASLLATCPSSYINNYDMQLSEQVYFEAGSSFWIVVKFPAGQKSPLSAGYMAEGKQIKQYSFYSSDNGVTWTQLSEVLREGNLSQYADRLTWVITAVSKNPDWSSVLDPEPKEGTVRPGESQT